MILKVDDYQKIPVILSKNTWYKKLLDPIFGHPEVKPFLPEIKETIINPQYIFRSIRDPRSKLFITVIKTEKFASYFLVVVIKYVKDDDSTTGYISTVMINRKLPKYSTKLWERKILT
ncbi:hypothetical protein A3D78_05680 [Candidatus Gottesmanbacteria bacterium RIFCSPHIGHO2_02_FULL_39_14]|uniref:Phage-Barnase-EndoU-ColicinE5/D-RelE like nuclease 3 domain-containing protein n=2 Tax=Candidatus Gottesmaniibacteriota TaxID=1752720 RepID=A0A1F6A2L7_9BACT|nr:MAG: hypothetical protein A3D78_05680 [Candidatus Gottesmanbacteria bacterium RIFCSPHIGHO2_02_FULL_39_14]OGG31205.1 MAG: hypothetical protein A3I51_04985 [Candidatus Gottesmanbacteria bacterium RIFCSPLOWO2_02_FULL_38_8]